MEPSTPAQGRNCSGGVSSGKTNETLVLIGQVLQGVVSNWLPRLTRSLSALGVVVLPKLLGHTRVWVKSTSIGVRLTHHRIDLGCDPKVRKVSEMILFAPVTIFLWGIVDVFWSRVVECIQIVGSELIEYICVSTTGGGRWLWRSLGWRSAG